MADKHNLRCEHGFTKVCGVCDPFVASKTDPRDVAWPDCPDCGGGGDAIYGASTNASETCRTCGGSGKAQ